MSVSNFSNFSLLLHHCRIQGREVNSSQICQFRSILNSAIFAIFCSICSEILVILWISSIFFWISLQILWNPWISIKSLVSVYLSIYYLYVVNQIMQIVYFLCFRGQRWSVFVWFILYITCQFTSLYVSMSFCNK